MGLGSICLNWHGTQLSTNTARGLGLIGIQERIELLGGELDINSAPGSGTHIHIRVPLQERSPASD